MTKEQYRISRRNNAITRLQLGILGNDNLVLHHIDTTMKSENIERYIQWNIEDLLIVTRSEHNKIHKIYLNRKNYAHSDETKQKMSESAIHRKVLCIETNIIYSSIKDASIDLCISEGNICSCCKGIRKTASGLHFEYVNN